MQILKNELNSFKKYNYGTHRSCSPDETFERILPHFPSLGITRIADITGLDYIGIPVCLCIRPNSKSLSVSQGKGITLMQAKVSAAMESIETHHAQNDNLELTIGSYRELAQREAVIDPKTLNLRAKSLYHDCMPITWVKGFDIINMTELFVPYDLVHCRFLIEPLRKPRCFIWSTDGLASGNNILEAISYGICEVVERDASILTDWDIGGGGNDMGLYFIDPDTIDSPLCREILKKLRSAGMVVYIWNETSDIGIPVLGCCIFEGEFSGLSNPIGSGCFMGFGCHLSKEIALIKAITEAIQSRLTYISGSRDDLLRSKYIRLQAQANEKNIQSMLSGIQPSGNFADLPSLETNCMKDDILTQLSLLKEKEFDQVVVVDMSQSQLGISVVRVIIPGLALEVHGEHVARRTHQRSHGREGGR